MIAADKNLLKANLQKGILGMQSRLIELYVSNLQAIGTQAAFIASLGYIGIGEIRMPSTGYTWFGLQFLFDFFIHLSMILGVFATTQSAVVSVYGPTVALKGAEHNVVLMVANKMREQRLFVLQIGALTLVSIFFAMLFNFWAKVPPSVCISTTVLYIIGFCLCISEGLRCYNIFHPEKQVKLTLQGIQEVNTRRRKKQQKGTRGNYQAVTVSGASRTGSGDSSGNNVRRMHSGGSSAVGSALGSEYVVSESALAEMDEETKAQVQEQLSLNREAMLQARGRLWWRESLDEGGELVERFAVLNKGRMDLYASEEDYKETKNPLNAKPFKLWQYAIVTDYKKFPKHMTSGLMSFRELVTGQGEVGLFDLATSEFDLKEAVKKYRFAILPKVFSELSPIPSAEFMAADFDDYRQWVKTFTRVISAFEKLDKLQEEEEGLALSDATSVERIVHAANI